MPDLLNDAIKEAYEYAPQDITYWDTLEIDHQSFIDPILVVRDFRPLTTLQGEFVPIMFGFALPETEPGVKGEMIITLNNVPMEARLKIREASQSRHKITVIYRQYIAENANPDVELPVSLQIRSIKETPNGLEARAMFSDLVSAKFPRRIMTAEVLPGCRTWPTTVSGSIDIISSGYIYGGWDSSYLQDCDQYTPDVWVSKSNIPAPARYQLVASTLGSSSYIYGGFDGVHLQDCDQYTPDVWASKTNMPLPARRNLAASTIWSSGYIFGGSDGTFVLQDCDQYTPDTWASKTDMPAPGRLYLAASAIGSSGYIYGGYSTSCLQDCDQYTPDVWVSKSNIPAPARYQLVASTIGSSGYIFGGSDGISVIMQDCDEYTPDVWVSKTDMPVPGRHHLAASTIGSSGYIYGGRDLFVVRLQDCDEYTPDAWASKTDIPAPARCYLAASTI